MRALTDFPQRLARYALAPATAAAAFGLRLAMNPVLQDEVPYETFYMAVAVSARYGGLGAGIAATLLGGAAGLYYFVPPHGMAMPSAAEQVAFALYLLVSAVILQLHEAQRRARQRAETGQRTLHAVLDHIPEGVAIADESGRVQMLSRWGEEMPANPGSVYRPGESEPARWPELPLARAVREGQTVANEEWSIRRPEGAAIPILYDAAPILDRDGRIRGAVAVWRDISQRKELEEKARDAAKLESLGVLAGGVAHDFNNLLTTIMGYASLLEGSADEGSLVQTSARAVLEAADTAARLTRQLLAYSGRSRFMLESLDLSRVVRGMEGAIRTAAGKKIDVQFDLATDLPPVEADATQVQQLIMNLVLNAVEAIDDRDGRVRLVTRAVELDDAHIAGLTGADRASPGPFALFEVQDTGSGIDDDVMPRVFDPFFTTRFTGRGLGLSAVLGIVRGHCGGIKAHSAPGVGTTFRVYLPARGRR